MKVCGLVRVSSIEQSEQGISIDAQKRIIQEYCEKNDLELTKTYFDDGKSGSLQEDKLTIIDNGRAIIPTMDYSQRTGFSELMQDAKKGCFNIILVTKWDRFSRNSAFLYLCSKYLERLKIKVMAISESNEVLVRDIMSVFAQLEITKLKSRLNDVYQEMFDKGIHPHKALFGYDKLFSYHGKKRFCVGLKPNKDSGIIQKAFSKFLLECDTDYKFFVDTYGIKPKTYYTFFWYVDFYGGFITYNGQTKKGIHEPLISSENYERIKLLLKKLRVKTQNSD